MRGVHAGAAARGFFRAAGVRGAVGAEEELWIAGSRRRDERLAVLLALEHRQAVMVRAHAAEEERVSIHEQMMRGDRGGDIPAGHFDELRRLARGDVLEHDPQRRKTRDERSEYLLDEHALAVEHVDCRIGHFAVHEER